MCEGGRGRLKNTRIITIQLNRAQKNAKKKQKVDQKILGAMKLSETCIFVFMIRAIARIRSAITSPYPHPVDAVQNIPLFINLSTDVFFFPMIRLRLHSHARTCTTRGEKNNFLLSPPTPLCVCGFYFHARARRSRKRKRDL